jgi:hypothetical protein
MDVVHNLPTKLAKKLLDEKLLFFSFQAHSKSSECQKMVAMAFLSELSQWNA